MLGIISTKSTRQFFKKIVNKDVEKIKDKANEELLAIIKDKKSDLEAQLKIFGMKYPSIEKIELTFFSASKVVKELKKRRLGK